jgi:hypothetical protein
VAAPLGIATTAHAETTGEVNAVAAAPVPQGIAVAVTARDANERSAILLPEVERALRAQGYGIDPQSPWKLLVSAADDEQRDLSLLRLQGRIGSDSRPDLGVEVALPKWPGPTSAAALHHYNVSMTFGESGRPPLWQGSGTAVRLDQQSLATDKALAAAVIARFGETVTGWPVPLP